MVGGIDKFKIFADEDIGFNKVISLKKAYLIDQISKYANVNYQKSVLLKKESEHVRDYEMNEIRKIIKNDWVEVKWRNNMYHVPVKVLESMLDEIPREECVRIKEFRSTSMSGMLWNNEKNDTIIEAVHCGMKGLWNWNSQVSIYILNEYGEKLVEKIAAANTYYTFNYEKREWERQEDKELIRVVLKDYIIKQLMDLSRVIMRRKIKTKVQWIVSDDELLIFDLYNSIEGEFGL